MKTISVAYIPPRTVQGAIAFYENLQKFPPAGELITFSDSEWPGALRLKVSIDIFAKGNVNSAFAEGEHAGKHNPHSRHNALWLTGIKMALDRGATHMLYLEHDCRVGRQGWDGVIFDEYFSLPHPTIVAGTLSVYNPSNFGVEAAKRAREVIAKQPRHGVPVGVYGWLGAAAQQDPHPACVFPNGALAVYDLLWMSRMWELSEVIYSARQNGPYDMATGQHLWKKFEADTYDLIGYLSSVYSGYGDALTTPEFRRQLLLDGKVVAMHQEKTDWQP